MIGRALLVFALILGTGSTLLGQSTGSGGDTLTAPPGQVGEGVRGGDAATDTTDALDLRGQVLRKLRALDEASRPRPAQDTLVSSGGEAGDSTDLPVGEAPPDSLVEVAGEVEFDSLGAPVPKRVVEPPEFLLLERDSLVHRLRDLEGYLVTEYQASSARFDSESGRLDLVGNPQLVRDSESMRADSLLTYDQGTSIVCGYGKPVLSGTGSDPVESDQVCYDVDRQVGVALGARTTFTQQGTWFVHGSELYTSGNDRLYGAATSFTTCDLDEPHYHFSAREMKVVHESVLVARNVTIKFGDVPVLWLPFMAQSLKPDRRSGLLTPSIGLQHVVRTSSGYRREIRDIGFYWALNDHLGLTSSMDWQSGGYIALSGQLQYRWLRQFLGGNIHFSRFWEFDRGTRFALSGSTDWRPGERTTLRSSVNYASSNDFVRRYSVDPEELNRSIDSNIGLTHRFSWGNLNLTGSRRQHLSNDQVDLTFPSASLSLDPITLFSSTEDPRWYNNATWQNNLSFSSSGRTLDLTRPSEKGQNTSTLRGRVDSRLTLGKLGWSGGFEFDEQVNQARPTWYDPAAPDTVVPDSLVLGRAIDQKMRWSTGLTFTQRLIENTTLSPSISANGAFRMQTGLPDSLDVHGHIAEPVRINAGASLRTNVFGFWPGIGPYSRIRHRLEPAFSYSYSPEPEVTDLQRRAFGSAYDALRETNQLTISLSQTFEAKPVARDTTPEEVVEDTLPGIFGEAPPRRQTQVRPITLLSISSTALVYDFAKRKEGEYGLTTTQMTHNLHSDLVPGLRLNIGHDLWKDAAGGGTGGSGVGAGRTFSPRLRTVNANFSLSSDSWPFRLFGGGEGGSAGFAEEMGDDHDLPPDEQGDLARSVIPGRAAHREPTFSGNQAVGSWRGDFTYSMTRPAAGMSGENNQLLRFQLGFQPTEKWNVSWNSAYSITAGEFADHVLTLNRDLHRWRASFHFSRTQFGAFTFRFNVQLLDNPDIKVDYDQRSLPAPDPLR